MTDPLFIIEMDFGKHGREFSGDRNMTRADVVEAIALGSNRVVKVLEIREDDNHCEDITEEIALEVAQRFADDREEVSYAVMNFLHDHHPAGVTSTHGLNVAA